MTADSETGIPTLSGWFPALNYPLSQDITQSMLDALPGFVYLLAEDFRFLYTNRFFDNEFGKFDSKTPCYYIMKGTSEPCSPCPAKIVFKDRSEQYWTWHDLRGGKCYEVFDLPCTVEGSLYVMGLGIPFQKKRDIQNQNLVADQLHRVCAHCRHIHDAKSDTWMQMESYFHKKYSLFFSHGICPKCLRKHYAGLRIDIPE